MSASPSFVLVGHCGPDMFMLKTAVSRAVDDATVTFVNDADALTRHLNARTVLLVNRQLDGMFATACGIELIGDLSAGDNAPTCILVSNLPHAQEQAIAAGALPGFGKSALYDDRTVTILRDAME